MLPDIAMVHATYPPTATRKLVEAFMSPELPSRPGGVKEVVNFVYGDRDGFHTIVILEVDDAGLAQCMKNQVERNVFLQSRVEGLRIEVHTALPREDAIKIASQLAA